jgi:hypothetical protein
VTFAQITRRDSGYKAITSGRSLTRNEHALEECLMKIAERELGKLRIQLSDLKGTIREDRQKLKRTKVEGQLSVERERMTIMMRVLRAPRSVGSFLITPFEESIGQRRIGVDGNRLVSDASGGAPFGPTRDDEVDLIGPEQVAEPADAPTAGWSKQLYDALPKSFQVVADIVAIQLHRLTPLSTAILLILVITGAWVWAEHSKSALQAMYDAVIKHRDELKATNGELESRLEKLKGNEAELVRLRTANEGSELQVRNLEKSVSEAQTRLTNVEDQHRKALEQVRKDHEIEIDRFQKSLDSASKAKIANLEKQHEADQATINGINTKLQDQAKELGRLGNVENELREKQRSLNNAIATTEIQEKTLNHQSSELADLGHERDYFKGLAVGMTRILDKGLLNCQTQYCVYYQNEYRQKFDELFDANTDLFIRAGLRKYPAN